MNLVGVSRPGPVAVELCTVCPARRECLTDALSMSYTEGIWAGTTYRDPGKVKHLPAKLAVGVWEAEFELRLRRRGKAAGKPPKKPEGELLLSERPERGRSPVTPYFLK